MSIQALHKRIERMEKQVPPLEEGRECDTWPPALSWFPVEEQAQVKELIARISPRLVYDNGNINYDQMTEDEVREMAVVQELVQSRSRGYR